jgi:hypothetical protein
MVRAVSYHHRRQPYCHAAHAGLVSGVTRKGLLIGRDTVFCRDWHTHAIAPTGGDIWSIVASIIDDEDRLRSGKISKAGFRLTFVQIVSIVNVRAGYKVPNFAYPMVRNRHFG